MSSILPLTVPAAAQLLLDFIGTTEAPRGFDTVYGDNQAKLPKPLTSMTLGEVIDAQPEWSKSFRSSAAGRYQFMRATLQGICTEVPSLRGDVLFDATLQNRLGYYLLLRRGFDNFVNGRISLEAFGKALAQEWASFPVLVACKGDKRNVDRGQSYYAGDGLNKALVKPELVEQKLQAVLLAAKVFAAGATPVIAAVNDNPAPLPAPVPPPVKVGWLAAILSAFRRKSA